MSTIQKPKYIISPITTWEDNEMLWATKLGIEGKNMPLHYTVWGKTEQESRERTEKLAEILAKEYSKSS